MDRLSAQARAAVTEADAVARRLGHEYVGTEHLLAGLAHGSGGAALALARCGLDGPRIETQIETLLGRGRRSLTVQPPRTAAAGRALARSRWEARSTGSDEVSSVHLLLALLHQPDATALVVLRELGTEPASLEARLGPGDSTADPTAEAPAAPPPGGEPGPVDAGPEAPAVQLARLVGRVGRLEQELEELRALVRELSGGAGSGGAGGPTPER